jgi:hypothetical protein
LRQNLKAEEMKDIVVLGHIWPEIKAAEGALNLIAKDAHHTLAIMEGEVPVLLVSLFGDIGALIPLGEVPTGQLLRFVGEGIVWRIALPSRTLSKLTIPEVIVDRLADLGARRPISEADDDRPVE